MKGSRSLFYAGLVTSLVPTALLWLSLNMLFFVPLVVGLGCVAAGRVKRSETGRRRATGLGLVLCLLAAIGPFAVAGYFNRQGAPIRIIVPRDYRGEFLIIEAQEGRDPPLRDGECVYVIPKDGRLLVKSLAAFGRWHTESIVFDDGTVPKKYDHPAHAHDDEVAVYGGQITVGFGDPRPTMHFFVGTAKDASRAF
jgi:hypothetical protein